jgi:hypothetical protein
LLGAQHDEAVGLLGVGGDLGDELVGSDADRAAEAGGLLDRLLDAPGGGARALEPGEVEVGLVEPDHLHALHVGAQHVHHGPRALAVGLEVGLDEDRVRTVAPGALGRRGGEDAVAAGLIAGGGDNRARSVAGDDDRLAAQLGPPLQLDTDVEGVHVEVGVRVDPVGLAHDLSVTRPHDTTWA